MPSVAFTPETYVVQYREMLLREDGSGPLMTTMEIQGNTNITLINERFQTVIEGLNPSTQYSFQIISNNLVGTSMTSFTDFATPSSGAHMLFCTHTSRHSQ